MTLITLISSNTTHSRNVLDTYIDDRTTVQAKSSYTFSKRKKKRRMNDIMKIGLVCRAQNLDCVALSIFYQ